MHSYFSTQVQRRWEDRRPIDPSDRSQLEQQVAQTNAYFQVAETRELADMVINTDEVRIDSPHILRKILEKLFE